MIYLSISTGCKVSSDNKRVGDPDPKASNCTCWPMPSRRIATTLIEKAERGLMKLGVKRSRNKVGMQPQSVMIVTFLSSLSVYTSYKYVTYSYMLSTYLTHFHHISIVSLSKFCHGFGQFVVGPGHSQIATTNFQSFSAWLVDAVETLERTWTKYEAMERPPNMVFL